ncbi:MAG: hypothetical protein EOP10_27350 [Proteobacteria bacterium]|nr:MAG: hypothetical protein EOP10_27350 [Pseudomonadota bacterium]
MRPPFWFARDAAQVMRESPNISGGAPDWTDGVESPMRALMRGMHEAQRAFDEVQRACCLLAKSSHWPRSAMSNDVLQDAAQAIVAFAIFADDLFDAGFHLAYPNPVQFTS